MKVVKKAFVILLVLIFLIPVFIQGKVGAKTIEEIQKEIEDYEVELSRLTSEANTLSNQIKQFDAQISLTTLKISQTEEKILLLGGRIDQLEGSLSSLSEAFSSRAVETYKMVRLGDPLLLLVSSSDLKNAVSRYHYLQRIQEADRSLLERLQKAQTVYKDEKTDQEELQAQLEKQKDLLAKQKKEKANLLAVTRNDEARYQQLLAAARAELAIALGQGTETFLRDVSEGEKIGTVIYGSSGCSSGSHLHFEVHNGTSIQDPNNYLRPISYSYSYSDTSYYGSISPHGGWNWPMNEPIVINQGYGSHGFARTFYPGGTHNGIDLESDSSTTVKSVRSGKLYGGSYTCSGTYAGVLLYAKVDHGDGFTTWYLHMTPQ